MQWKCPKCGQFSHNICGHILSNKEKQKMMWSAKMGRATRASPNPNGQWERT
jgi:hypothetical protein